MGRNAWRGKPWDDLGKQTRRVQTWQIGADCTKYGQQQGRPDHRRWTDDGHSVTVRKQIEGVYTGLEMSRVYRVLELISSPARYDGAVPCRHLYIRTACLTWILSGALSQWRDNLRRTSATRERMNLGNLHQIYHSTRRVAMCWSMDSRFIADFVWKRRLLKIWLKHSVSSEWVRFSKQLLIMLFDLLIKKSFFFMSAMLSHVEKKSQNGWLYTRLRLQRRKRVASWNVFFAQLWCSHSR